MFGDPVRVGHWKYYNKARNLTRIENWNKGSLNGVIVEWHENGMLKLVGMCHDNMEVGRWFYYADNGAIEKEINFDRK